jgi:hypothetical protein
MILLYMTKHHPWKTKDHRGLDYIRTLSNTRWNTNVSKEFSLGDSGGGGGVQINKGQIASPWATVPDYTKYQAMAALAGPS